MLNERLRLHARQVVEPYMALLSKAIGAAQAQGATDANIERVVLQGSIDNMRLCAGPLLAAAFIDFMEEEMRATFREHTKLEPPSRAVQ